MILIYFVICIFFESMIVASTYSSVLDDTPPSFFHGTWRNTYTTIHIYVRKHSQHNNDERIHFLKNIYHSHFIRNGCERVMCERWVGDWTNCNILTPSSFVFSSTSFSFCWAAQSGVQRAYSPLQGAGSLYSILSPTLTDSNLTEPVCGPGLYNYLTPNCFLWASHLHPIQLVHSQGYTLISSTGCTCSLIDGWVEGQYVTYVVHRVLGLNYKLWMSSWSYRRTSNSVS